MKVRGMPTTLFLSLLFLLLLKATAYDQGIEGMQVVGYADRLSVQPGETIRFMVSSKVSSYRADIVRLIHGDPSLQGPGFKEELIEMPINKEYPGRHQDVQTGSYVLVPDNPALRQTGSFTLQAWIYPTTPQKGAQAIMTKWSASDRVGYGLFLDRDGSLALWLGDKNGHVERIRTGKPFSAYRRAGRAKPGREPLHSSHWYFVAATYDASSGKVALCQEPAMVWPLVATPVVVERTLPMKSVGANELPFLMAGYWELYDAGEGVIGGHFNGKIESPRLFDRALTEQEVDLLKRGGSPKDPVAAWDFSADISSRKVMDTSANKLHGQTVNMPARAVTGHNWTGNETNFNHAGNQYGAIHFHDDDLDDAGWEVGFEFKVPVDFKSGVYAARLRAGNGEDYVPFFVRPRKGTTTARIAFLIPTFTYLAYGNSGSPDPLSLSLYDHHSDGSGVCYSSRLRPILTMRPKALTTWGEHSYARHLSADLYMVNFLEAKGYRYDVITDEDLHLEGMALLEPYQVVITGSHPEYWSGQMLDGLKAYLEKGGRLMYLGGNGFYWVTSMDPEQQHTIEIRRWGGTQAWQAEPGEYHHSTTGEMGGLWRFRGRQPQRLVGVGFTAQGPGRNMPYRRQPGSFDPRAAFIFEGIGPDELIGDFSSLVREYGAAGDELDRLDQQLGTPAHALLLASASDFPDTYQHVVEEVYNINDGPNDALVKADMVYFEYPNGGAVFSVGSISWNGALFYNEYNNTVARITENVLKRFASDEPLPD
ncbi:LamG domain-containing protein [Acidobacteria bacterium AH-259-G07]|nr:LamG domain-containing protein [Acidobacteria bacterium AH-259-G07]